MISTIGKAKPINESCQNWVGSIYAAAHDSTNMAKAMMFKKMNRPLRNGFIYNAEYKPLPVGTPCD